MVMPRTITAIYDKGVLTPTQKLKLRKRQTVRVQIIPIAPRKSVARSRPRKIAKRDELIKQRVRESFGSWAERADMGDAVDWINEIRAGWDGRLKEIYKDA